MNEARERPYAILDVFTDTPFKGNPLAVVLDGQGLSDDAMQVIAGEFNLSETVFVFPAGEASNTASIRIFTPSAELPFAGHPTVGTAVLLAKKKIGDVELPTDVAIALEEEIGLVSAGVVVKPGKLGHATFTLPVNPKEMSSDLSREHLADALGLNEDDIGFDKHRPIVYSAGVPFSLIPISSLDVIKGINPNPPAWEKAFESAARDNAFIYARGGESERAAFHARMFWPGAGICEDPATGSAIAAFAGAIYDFEKLGDGHHTFLIEQGYEMGRASDITLEIDAEDGEFIAARIGGSAVIVAEGVLYA